MKTLREIESEVSRLAAKIGASGHALPTFGHSQDGARPHVEVDSRGYHYVIVERGQEFQRNTTGDFDELLYHIFDFVTFSLASDYELAHRLPGQDSRRILFARQEELLSSLSHSWAERTRRDHQHILGLYPFVDR